MTVRALLALMLVVGGSVADAKPRPSLDRMEFDPGDIPVEPCGNGKTWPLVQKCLEKTGLVVTSIHQTAKTRAVTVAPKSAPNTPRVLLYAQNDQGTWIRTTVSLYTNANAELVRVDTVATPSGDAIRFDIGNTARTSFAITPPTSIRGVLRRTFTTVCTPSSWSCFTIMTGCEAYVRGKIYWSFHGELVWHPSLGMRMKGSRQIAGGVCKPNEGLMVDPETK